MADMQLYYCKKKGEKRGVEWSQKFGLKKMVDTVPEEKEKPHYFEVYFAWIIIFYF